MPGINGGGVGVGGGGGGGGGRVGIVGTGGGGGGGRGGIDDTVGRVVGLAVRDGQMVVPGKVGRWVKDGTSVVGRGGDSDGGHPLEGPSLQSMQYRAPGVRRPQLALGFRCRNSPMLRPQARAMDSQLSFSPAGTRKSQCPAWRARTASPPRWAGDAAVESGQAARNTVHWNRSFCFMTAISRK